MLNPWNIQSIYELQYFNCPSCVFKNSLKQEFIDHAYEIHPESHDCLSKIKDNSLSDVTCPWNEIFIKIKQEEPDEANEPKEANDPIEPSEVNEAIQPNDNEALFDVKTDQFNYDVQKCLCTRVF